MRIGTRITVKNVKTVPVPIERATTVRRKVRYAVSQVCTGTGIFFLLT